MGITLLPRGLATYGNGDGILEDDGDILIIDAKIVTARYLDNFKCQNSDSHGVVVHCAAKEFGIPDTSRVQFPLCLEDFTDSVFSGQI